MHFNDLSINEEAKCNVLVSFIAFLIVYIV